MEFKAYKQIIKILKEFCPLAYPVIVRRVALKSHDGDCTLYKKRFTIRINKSMNEGAAIDTLLHEWAHARAWNHLHDAVNEKEFAKRVHDASWGVAYSEVYRTYEEHFLGDI